MLDYIKKMAVGEHARPVKSASHGWDADEAWFKLMATLEDPPYSSDSPSSPGSRMRALPNWLREGITKLSRSGPTSPIKSPSNGAVAGKRAASPSPLTLPPPKIQRILSPLTLSPMALSPPKLRRALSPLDMTPLRLQLSEEDARADLAALQGSTDVTRAPRKKLKTTSRVGRSLNFDSM
jgi:hypothetical protein